MNKTKAFIFRFLQGNFFVFYGDFSFWKQAIRLGNSWDEATMLEPWNDKIRKSMAIVDRYFQPQLDFSE